MPTTIEHAATLLEQAHRRSRPIDTPPPDAGALTREQAFAIQDRVARAMGGVGAWKVGARTPDALPNAAPIFPSRIVASPAALPARGVQAASVEAEVAFRFERALPPRGAPYSGDEVIGAVGALVPAIEVVDSRLGAWAGDFPMWKLADNQSNGHLVLGAELRQWRALDLEHCGIELWVDGACVVPGTASANPAGDPLHLLTWLANHLSATRTGLAAGAIVTTGSYTGMCPVLPGQRVVARYPAIGEVDVSFTPPR